jgi:hypothetical protein
VNRLRKPEPVFFPMHSIDSQYEYMELKGDKIFLKTQFLRYIDDVTPTMVAGGRS